MSNPIKFQCPRCEARHERGYLDGVSLFRCLGCGYQGHGFHPDPEIDAAVMASIEEAYALDASFGLPVPPREEWRP